MGKTAYEITLDYPRHEPVLNAALRAFIKTVIDIIDSKGVISKILKWVCPIQSIRDELLDQLVELDLRVTLKSKSVPRGIRNNNWGNIRLQRWQIRNIQEGGWKRYWFGEVQGEDKEFASFKNVAMGLRAMIKMLRTYKRAYGITTVEGAIKRYAPPNGRDSNNVAYKNKTEAYINYVLQHVGPEIQHYDKCYMRRLIRAMCEMENGKWKIAEVWSDELFNAAYDLA